MSVIFENLKEDLAQTYAVVLSAAGIEFDFIRGSRGWNLRVDSEDHADARKAIASYLSENEDHHQKETAPPEAQQKTVAGVWVALVLLAVHIFITQTAGERMFIVRYGASAEDILTGQYYRAVTALMLHADSVHLAGNMVGIALFGTAVCSVTGWGVGWLIILLSGAAGNLLNAVFYQTDHLSIGASTAVFGAVGFSGDCAVSETVPEAGASDRGVDTAGRRSCTFRSIGDGAACGSGGASVWFWKRNNFRFYLLPFVQAAGVGTLSNRLFFNCFRNSDGLLVGGHRRPLMEKMPADRRDQAELPQ